MIAFGPIPSRRLGCSLGINNIPPKICSYAYIYCQLGKTSQMIVNPQTFYSPDKPFLSPVQKHLKINFDKY